MPERKYFEKSEVEIFTLRNYCCLGHRHLYGYNFHRDKGDTSSPRVLSLTQSLANSSSMFHSLVHSIY